MAWPRCAMCFRQRTMVKVVEESSPAACSQVGLAEHSITGHEPCSREALWPRLLQTTSPAAGT